MAQGKHRFARGHTFFYSVIRAASARGVAPNWSMTVVPGVGHDNSGMAQVAAQLLMGGPDMTGQAAGVREEPARQSVDEAASEKRRQPRRVQRAKNGQQQEVE